MELKWIPEPHGIIEGIISALIIFAVGLIYGPFRRFFFNTTYEYVLKCNGGKTVWDIKTPRLLLTVEAGEVHDDYIEDVEIKVNAERTSTLNQRIGVRDSLIQLEGHDIRVGVASILRTFDPVSYTKEYEIRLIVQRRRFIFTP
jgi:hypothetical protein